MAEPGLSFICEVKKASPSKGVIAEEFPYLDIAKSYEAAGAAAISCLTEPKWFMGADAYLTEIAAETSVPVLRKDFVVCERMIYQAKVLGASAVLLICAILSDEQLVAYRELAESLGLSVLVEAHDEKEIARAVASGAKIVGVNNRNLKDFSVDFDNVRRLRAHIPEDVLYVAESGVASADDVAAIAQMGADAALIGEALMRAGSKREQRWRDSVLAADALIGPAPSRQHQARENAAAIRHQFGIRGVKLYAGMSREMSRARCPRRPMCGFIVDFPQSHRSVSVERLTNYAFSMKRMPRWQPAWQPAAIR